MKRLLIPATVILVVTIGWLAHARPVRIATPEELYNRSETVMIGIVTEVTDTGKTSTIQLGTNNPAYPVRVRHAKVNVVETLKGGRKVRTLTGGPKEEIVIEYAPLDWERVQAVTNGPIRIRLEKSKVYVMYLKKKANEDLYVGALDGEFDDGMAVKLLRLRPPEQTNAVDGK